MPDIFFHCTSCGRGLVIDGAGAGIQVTCPDCNAVLQVAETNDVTEGVAIPNSPRARVRHPRSVPETAPDVWDNPPNSPDPPGEVAVTSDSGDALKLYVVVAVIIALGGLLMWGLNSPSNTSSSVGSAGRSVPATQGSPPTPPAASPQVFPKSPMPDALSDQAKRDEPTPTAHQTDPTSDLKEHLQHLEKYYAQKTKERTAVNRLTWYRLLDLKYDVQRTQSLVSPYVAYVYESELGYWEATDTGESGESGSIDDYRLTLCYQEGRWVITDVLFRSTFRRGGVLVDWMSDNDMIPTFNRRLGF